MKNNPHCTRHRLHTVHTALAAAFLATTGTIAMEQCAHAQSRSQYVAFQRVTDTVRLTHEVPTTTALTMEARVWIDAASSSFGFEHAAWREQRNSLEDKGFAVCSIGVRMFIAGTTDIITWSGGMPMGRWVHVACQQSDGRARVWVDGELKVDVVTTSNTIYGAIGSSNSIGAGVHNNSSVIPGSLGKIDWLRVSTCAVYGASDFTPPTECDVIQAQPYACTALLFTFDEPVGSTSLSNRGSLPGIASIGANWFAGATSPSLAGVTQDSDGDGIPDVCECPGDILGDGIINGADLAALLSYWGSVTTSPVSQACDFNGDDRVDGADLSYLLSAWGPCPN